MTPNTSGTATWEEDPSGASIVLATGRRRHDLLVVAEPALLTDLDEAWGRPLARVRLSFLPGVSAPGNPGDEDALYSYDRDGLGVLVARGRTRAYEGKPVRRTTSLVRIAAGAGVRAALMITRATSVGLARPGDFLAIADHLNLTGAPLFASTQMLDAAWDENLGAAVANALGVRGAGLVALTPGPLRPTRAEARLYGGLGADAVVTDSVAEAMTLASRGIRAAGLVYVDRLAAGLDAAAKPTGRRAAAATTTPSNVPAPVTVRAAIESVLAQL